MDYRVCELCEEPMFIETSHGLVCRCDQVVVSGSLRKAMIKRYKEIDELREARKRVTAEEFSVTYSDQNYASTVRYLNARNLSRTISGKQYYCAACSLGRACICHASFDRENKEQQDLINQSLKAHDEAEDPWSSKEWAQCYIRVLEYQLEES